MGDTLRIGAPDDPLIRKTWVAQGAFVISPVRKVGALYAMYGVAFRSVPEVRMRLDMKRFTSNGRYRT